MASLLPLPHNLVSSPALYDRNQLIRPFLNSRTTLICSLQFTGAQDLLCHRGGAADHRHRRGVGPHKPVEEPEAELPCDQARAIRSSWNLRADHRPPRSRVVPYGAANAEAAPGRGEHAARYHSGNSPTPVSSSKRTASGAHHTRRGARRH